MFDLREGRAASSGTDARRPEANFHADAPEFGALLSSVLDHPLLQNALGSSKAPLLRSNSPGNIVPDYYKVPPV